MIFCLSAIVSGAMVSLTVWTVPTKQVNIVGLTLMKRVSFVAHTTEKSPRNKCATVLLTVLGIYRMNSDPLVRVGVVATKLVVTRLCVIIRRFSYTEAISRVIN